MTTFGSVCSGIEAASVAWRPRGWRAAWLSEIEPAPCSLLAHHYPDVPNLGDMTRIPQMLRNGDIPAPDVFCGGTPCQAFSVAGLRNSLDDARGNLSLIYCDITDEIDIQRRANGLLPCIAIWENVPGVLSTKDNAFGCFLGQLAGEDCPLVAPGGKWPNAGVVLGPKRAIAWRVLDAQYFGVAQRRRRVLVVASAREGFDPAAVLFEFDGVRRDSAPSRQTGQDAAAATLRSTDGGCDVDHATGGHLQPVQRTGCGALQHVTGTLSVGGKASGSATQQDAHADLLVPVAFCQNSRDEVRLMNGDGQIVGALAAEPGMKQTCYLAYAFQPRIARNGRGDMGDLVSALTAQAGETGKGDAAPCVAIAFNARQDPDHWYDRTGPLDTDGGTQAVCVTGDIIHTLKAEGFDASEDGAGRGQPIIAVPTGCDGTIDGPVPPLMARSSRGGAQTLSPGHQTDGHMIGFGMAVRRLTPRECERLQGFPSVKEMVTIDVCLDPLKNCVDVALQCHRSLSDAWPAGESVSTPHAKVAATISSTPPAAHAPHVALRVLTNSGGDHLQILSRGKLVWSANAAESSDKSRPPMSADVTVAALAQHARELASLVRSGKVGSQLSIPFSTAANRGAISALKSGVESAECVNGAATDASPERFTTSELGWLIRSAGSTKETSLCSVLAAISSFIPSETLPANFSLQIDLDTPYTLIPNRGKPMADGPRYKALGNSWAVPKFAWLGERIDAALRGAA